MPQLRCSIPPLFPVDVIGIQKLPQELCDHTIAFLSDDKKSLRACGLTCKALRPLSRKFFWRRLHARNSTRLESLLSEHPDIAAFVHTLSISLHLTKLPLLLELTNLKALTWSDEDLDEDVDSSDIPARIPPLLLPGITALTVLCDDSLQSVQFIQLTACFPNISSLRVREYSFPIAAAINVDPQIEELRNTPFSLPRLTHLDFESGFLASVLPRLFCAAGHSLRRAKLIFHNEFGAATVDLLNFSANLLLTHLEASLRFDPATDRDWGDALAASLSNINSSHQSLAHILLHVPTFFPDRGTGLRRIWKAPGNRLGEELSRVMDEVPHVIVTFRQYSSMSPFAADHAHKTLGYNLRNGFPHLTNFQTRLRFEWDVWTRGGGERSVHNKPLIKD